LTDIYFFNSLGGYSYAAGTMLVAGVVAFFVFILRKTLLKKYAKNSLMTWLTFFLGVVLYAVYDCITERSLERLWEDSGMILQEGISSGCFATMIDAFIDNLLGKSDLTGNAAIIRKLIEGFVEEDDLDGVAKEIAEAVSAEYSDEDVQKVKKILSDYKQEKENRSAETEAELLARLILESLKRTA
jgi:hypothetical protein